MRKLETAGSVLWFNSQQVASLDSRCPNVSQVCLASMSWFQLPSAVVVKLASTASRQADELVVVGVGKPRGREGESKSATAKKERSVNG